MLLYQEKETKVRHSIAEDYEAKGNLVTAASWRRELSLQDWVYWALISAISSDVTTNSVKEARIK